MLTTFLDKLSSLFDKRFLIAYWGPLFVGLALAVGMWSAQAGPTAASAWWDAQSISQQLLVGLGLLFALTVLAFVLQAFSLPLVRLYEGYWPGWLGWLERRCIAAEAARRRRLLAAGDPRTACYSYPADERLVRATRLGNTMTAAEEYAWFVYRADAIIWWPRLAAILPETLRGQIDGSYTPLVALLNLSTILLLWAAAGGAWLLWQGANPWLYALVVGGGLLLAWFCARAAITQAEEYGDQVRTAFDLHRRDLLARLCLPLPGDLVQEQFLWRKLGNLHYHRTYPWVRVAGLEPDQLPFDSQSPPAAPPAGQTVHVTLEGTPTVIVRQPGGE